MTDNNTILVINIKKNGFIVWIFLLTSVPHCGQHLPGITYTVCPLAKQVGHFLPGTGMLCRGKLTNACGLGGLFKHHSKLSKILFNFVRNKSLWYWEVNQGYLDVELPFTNWIYKICKNNHVAITDIIDPKLLMKFQPAKASA